MLIDCHVHFDPELVSADGMVQSMDRWGIDRAVLIGKLQPDVVHTPMLEYGAPILRRAIRSRVRPIRRLVRGLYKSWSHGDGTVELGGHTYEVNSDPDNGVIQEALDTYPDRFWGWIFVNPLGQDRPVEVVEACLKRPGWIGVKTHPYWHAIPIRELEEVADLCAQRGLPLLVHLGTTETGDYKLLPERFDKLRVIYAHAGVPYQRAVCAYARERHNVWVDLSSPGFVDATMARIAIDLAGVDKCLFGSDGPYFQHSNGQLNYGVNLAILDGIGLDPADRERVAGANFSSLIGGN